MLLLSFRRMILHCMCAINSNTLLDISAPAAATACLLVHCTMLLSIKCSHTLIATAIHTTVLLLSQRRAHHSALLPHDDVTVHPSNGIQVHVVLRYEPVAHTHN
jgi:hypothetical protein